MSGIGKAADAVSEALLAAAIPVDGKNAIAQVATVSSRDEEVGEMVGEAMTKVGADGVVTVEESSTMNTELEITDGVQFRQGLPVGRTSSPTSTRRRPSSRTR